MSPATSATDDPCAAGAARLDGFDLPRVRLAQSGELVDMKSRLHPHVRVSGARVGLELLDAFVPQRQLVARLGHLQFQGCVLAQESPVYSDELLQPLLHCCEFLPLLRAEGCIRAVFIFMAFGVWKVEKFFGKLAGEIL